MPGQPDSVVNWHHQPNANSISKDAAADLILFTQSQGSEVSAQVEISSFFAQISLHGRQSSRIWGMEFVLRRISRALLLCLALVIVSDAYDFQYFLPQEFLSDLPFTQGSFAAEVIATVLDANFPDVHETVDCGTFTECSGDTDFNSESYRSRRQVCVRVPPGGNPHADPHMCEHAGSRAPRAEILEAKDSTDVGEFTFGAEFQFLIPGHIDAHSKTCVILCFHDDICHNDVTVTGALQVQSTVHVRKEERGTLKFLPNTVVSWQSGPEVDGCHPDWLVRLFGNVEDRLADYVRDAAQDYVTKNLQTPLSLPQTIALHPPVLNLTYHLRDLQFVHSTQPSSQSFVVADASCTIHAKAPNGSMQAFPDESAPWTGKHNVLPLDDEWRRTVGSGSSQLVLLGGARFSEELLTVLTRSMHYAGMLYSASSRHVKDAQLYSTIDGSCPEVDISEARAGVIMRQDHLLFKMACRDTTAVNASNFSLLSATFSKVLEEISVSAFVPNSSMAGIKLQVLNVSMGSANVTSFHSQAFIGSGSGLKTLALRAVRKSIPLINEQLNHTPIIMCRGGSACALVPFVSHPSVTTIPQRKGRAGYVQLSFQCQCGSSDFYQSCAGFHCPELKMRQLRQAPASSPALPRLASFIQGTPNRSLDLWFSIYSNANCSFLPGHSMSFANVSEDKCTASSHDSLAPAFKVHGYHDGWYLSSECTADCSRCRSTQWIPLRRCTCTVSGTCIILAAASDGCVPWFSSSGLR